ncbi:MAG: acyl-CoA dehydrogenase family protein [Deltaproteobacteria bacterium]|nr:acyl-CoA dehydrogenase family protein [Deltaproteobacteria bacterium]
MELIPYTEAHRIFRESLRKFLAREVIPYIDEWESAGIVPRSAWKKMGDQGFLCMDVPEAYGGLGADFLYTVIVVEEMTRTNHCGLAARLHSNVVVPYITEFATEEQKRHYLPRCIAGDCITAIAMSEPQAGSDLAAIRTTAVEEKDAFVLNGQKTFISNGINGDLFVVAARDPAIEKPQAAIDLYLVEAGTPGFSKGKRLQKIGWRSQDTAELFFTDCRIPKANRLGEKGTGFRKLMRNLQPERLVLAVSAVTAAQMAFDMTREYCRQRTVFGKTLNRLQHVQFELAEMATEIALGRTFVDKLIGDYLEGGDVALEVSMAKYWTTEMAFRVADRCLQLHGGYGYCEEYPIARIWRDLRVTRILGGSSEIMRGIIARHLGL